MKKLIHKTIQADDPIVFFSDERQFTDWVDNQGKGTLLAADDHNNVYTVMSIDNNVNTIMIMDGDGPWAICHLRGFRTLTFKVLVRDFELSWVDNDQMLHLIDICEN